MKSSVKNRAKGIAKEVTGRVKEAVGQATNNPRLERKGRVEANLGRAREKVGEAQRAFEKATK